MLEFDARLESDMGDKKVICNGVGYEGNPGECKGKNEGVLCRLANQVGHLRQWRNVSDKAT